MRNATSEQAFVTLEMPGEGTYEVIAANKIEALAKGLGGPWTQAEVPPQVVTSSE